MDEQGFGGFETAHDAVEHPADDAGPRLTPVVFLPGLLCDQGLWRAQIDALADIAAPIVADLTLDDDIRAMAARALVAAPPRFALVALSMGGYVALEMMRQAPHRITRLALIDTSATPDAPIRAEQRRRGMASLQRGRFIGITSALLRQLIHADHVDGPVGDALRAMALRVGGAAFLRQQRAILNRPDPTATMARIRVPTLVAVGADDRITPPAHADHLHRQIAGSVLHRFPDCGHLPALECPDALNVVLRDWLDQAGRSAQVA